MKLRDDSDFLKIWIDIIELAHKLGVKYPVLKPQKHVPKRFETSPRDTAHTFPSPEEHYRAMFFQIIDKTTSSLYSRFESETMRILDQFENLILKKGVEASVISISYNDEAESREEYLQFDASNLERERDCLFSTIVQDKSFIFSLNPKVTKKKKMVAHEISDFDVWTLYYTITELPEYPREMFTIVAAIWADDVKPDMNTNLEPFCGELKEILQEGITWICPKTKTEHKTCVIASLLTADKPALAAILQRMHHTCVYGCETCEIEIQHSAQTPDGRRRKRIHKTPEVQSHVRTNEGIRRQALATQGL
ncbi:hypothetical protein QAD02_006483 [Eretmocerus hayati]|uniref:Uncharacterized protein n=1 Tax=Eretmocerus hayati TaxID=131215 RepID=A0ACC2N1C9_9HYME|nr:hypothetical protein QAD02_006483 [Eretmocerus hayati]